MTPANAFVTPDNIDRARSALYDSGVLLLPAVFDAEFCQAARVFMDAHQPDDRTESNYGGSELRIWDAHKRDQLMLAFWSACNGFVSALERKPAEAFTLLAIRNRPIPRDDEKLILGRWHIDSFRRQIKVFAFLTDTTNETGPFEFVPGTHSALFKARRLVNGDYITPGDVLTGKRSYARLDDALIDRLGENTAQPVPVLCKAGTVMAIDTSAIHRARPCTAGERYVLTAYFH
ncbi:MAG: phytanoyl-CoA dioxygenase family protein [Vicinamibacterales bacterium]